MPEWIVTVLLGVVEGITEFLPISSTGHLLIFQHFLGESRSELFNVGIQSGAVSAVVLIYWRKLLDLVQHFWKPEQLDYNLKLAAAFMVTVILGLSVRKAGFELPEDPVPIAWAVLIGAIFIFISEWRLAKTEPKEKITWSIAVWVGAAQVLAGIFPGTSRSAATIIMAMLLGVSRMLSTEFSFLLGIPTMFAAGAYLAYESYDEEGEAAFADMDQFWLGFVVSAVVAFIAVKWLLGFIRAHSFKPFAWYRLILGLGLLGWLYWQAS
ncbi:MAG: undecaprenyl-diphosphate phosphatase [Verrucomicrobiota bacterium]